MNRRELFGSIAAAAVAPPALAEQGMPRIVSTRLIPWEDGEQGIEVAFANGDSCAMPPVGMPLHQPPEPQHERDLIRRGSRDQLASLSRPRGRGDSM